MGLNIGLPFSFPTLKAPDYLADQQTSLANQKAQAELPYAARLKENEAIGQELDNVLKRITNQYAPEKQASDIAHTKATTGYTTAQTERTRARNPYEAQDIQADIAHKNAQAASLMQPKTGELGQAVADAQAIWAREGINSPIGKIVAEGLQKKLQGAPGEQITIDPNTGAVTITKGNAPGGGATGTVVNGKHVSPTTGQTTNQIQRAEIANVGREFLAQAAHQPFVGSKSNDELISTWNKVRTGKGTDEDREKLIQAAVAQKLIPERAVEQLRSQGIEATRFNIRAQEEALTLGWPLAAMKSIVSNLPKDMQEEANKRHDQILSESANRKRDAAVKGFPHELQQNDQGVPQQDVALKFDEALQVHEALNIVNAANPTSRPFNQQDVIESAAKHGMTPVEFAEYLKDLTIRQQNG